MDYSPGVRRRFDLPERAAATEGPAHAVCGAAADRSLNVWVRFVVSVAGGNIADVRYNAFGCPHVIAACEWVAEAVEGQPVAALGRVDLERLARELDVPREKFGKLLRIEDALGECADAVERTAMPPGAGAK